MKPLKSFFLEEFRELYRRERKWLIILPEVARNMPPAEVRTAVTEHLERTAAHVSRLEDIYQLLVQADAQASSTFQPLLREADDVLAAVTLSSVEARRLADTSLELDARTPGWKFNQFFPPSSQN
jgi:ferritin-like metal-binding protein YciE